MKIAYFSGSLKKNLDGVSRVLYRIAEYHKEHDIESVFISPETDPEIQARQLEVKGIRLPVYKEYKLGLSSGNSIRKKLNEINFRPDLIHIHSPCTTGIAALNVARRLRLPVVATYHTHFPSYLEYHRAGFLKKIAGHYLNYFYNQCDLVLVPSPSLKKELIEFGISNTEVVPHGVDSGIFNKRFYNPALKKNAQGKTVLLYTGRLVWEKNLRILVQAINSLAAQRNDFVLWMVGKGPIEQELKQTLKNTEFFGFCDGEKLSSLYATADVFVFPSATETFGNVTLEAMSSGLCCIVARARGSSDLITESKNGLAFDPQSQEELMVQLQIALDNPDLRTRMAEEAFRSSEKYRWNTILDRQFNIYQEVISLKSHILESKISK